MLALRTYLEEWLVRQFSIWMFVFLVGLVFLNVRLNKYIYIFFINNLVIVLF